MSDGILLEQSEGDIAVLVSFTWGSTTTRYSDQAYEIEHGGETWQPMPLLEAKFDKAITGTAEAEEVAVFADKTISPVEDLLLPYKHAPVKVTVYELDLVQDHSIIVFRGSVSRALVKRSKPAVAEIKCHSPKFRLKVIPGIQCVSRCTHPFGNNHDSPCDLTLGDKTWDAVIVATGVDDNPNRITVSWPGGEPTHSNNYWSNGQVVVDGARIKIKAWLGTNDFLLKHPIRDIFEGETVSMVAGCDKTKPNCIYWDNIEKFGATGIAMPDYQPNYGSE
jgi:hypothetical protein